MEHSTLKCFGMIFDIKILAFKAKKTSPLALEPAKHHKPHFHNIAVSIEIQEWPAQMHKISYLHIVPL